MGSFISEGIRNIRKNTYSPASQWQTLHFAMNSASPELNSQLYGERIVLLMKG